MATASYLFEAPPAHLDAPDGSYRRALLNPGAGPLLEALAWEDASPEHAESPKSAAEAARAWWARLLRPGFAAQLGVQDGDDVHHAIELQVLDKYPGAFSPRELNSFRNMRGIPPEVTPRGFQSRPNDVFADLARRRIQPNSPEWNAAVRSWHRHLRKEDLGRKQLHNSYIRKWWNRQYKGLNAAIASDPRLVPGSDPWRRYVRRYLAAGRTGLDRMVKGMFTEQRKGMDWTARRQGVVDRATIGLLDPATGRARPR